MMTFFHFIIYLYSDIRNHYLFTIFDNIAEWMDIHMFYDISCRKSENFIIKKYEYFRVAD